MGVWVGVDVADSVEVGVGVRVGVRVAVGAGVGELVGCGVGVAAGDSAATHVTVGSTLLVLEAELALGVRVTRLHERHRGDLQQALALSLLGPLGRLLDPLFRREEVPVE